MRSQRHLLDIRGKDSAGNIKGLGAIINDRCDVAGNANNPPATVRFGGFFAAGKAVSLTVTQTGGTATVTYTPASQEDSVTLASSMATAIEADATVGGLVTATAAGGVLRVVNQSTVTNGDSVVLSALSIA